MFEFLQAIYEFVSNGIYQFFVDAIAYFLKYLVIFWINMKTQGLLFAWNIAESTINALNVGQQIQPVWNSLSSDVRSNASFFRVPESLNILLTAFMTRFVMSMLPGF